MNHVLYSDIDLSISESQKSIIINPKGFRFYNIACEYQSSIYRNAQLSMDDEGRYVIEGTQMLYTEHLESSFSRERLLCMHPEELITQKSFLGLIRWYKADGIMKREAHSRYVCKHKDYLIHERLEFLSQTFEEF
jgi:hypothetical protein